MVVFIVITVYQEVIDLSACIHYEKEMSVLLKPSEKYLIYNKEINEFELTYTDPGMYSEDIYFILYATTNKYHRSFLHLPREFTDNWFILAYKEFLNPIEENMDKLPSMFIRDLLGQAHNLNIQDALLIMTNFSCFMDYKSKGYELNEIV